MHPKQRIVVGLLAALATVIHFTFGCCLHGSHAGNGHACGLATPRAAEAQHDCDCHGHDGDDAGEHRHGQEMQADEAACVESTTERDGHDCGGCDCVADTVVSDQGGDWWPLDSDLDALLDARDLAAAARMACCPVGACDPPPMPARHSLHERLLV